NCERLRREGAAAIALAASIDRTREYGRMPELADQLADAGFANPDVLSHCREAAMHTRGCWVIDLLLG
ncbi:MAG TPA: hypothetical protein VFE62_18735, partial [Gemmataceae bacterium]|nr:hypothetical protein [Gemmataceae bacterium]